MVELQRITCKCCGEPLDISKAINGVIKCAICDSIFVVAKKETSPAALTSLRIGEHDLDTCKFDEAYTAYKKAAELDPNEPEAYFGMALAEFKVQYLKDVSGEKPRLQPICHEVTDKKFSDNSNYMRAYMKGTAEQRAEYERKAQEIDYILGEFYKLKQSGLNYDCFICVKVTDDKTKLRTADYKDADDIYFSLRGKGYKPFFSERELGDVTGADYEARILYALYTSECMLVVCRDESYLQTSWVKNEYTRFLKLVNDEEKESDSITIAFNGKPIERLPGRKGKLQGIDLSKLGALSKIEAFVENHTPEARRKREEAVAAKSREAEEQKKRLAQMVEQQVQQQKAFEEQKRLLEEQQRRQQEELETQKRLLEEQQRRQQEEFEKQQELLKKQLDEMQKASAVTSATPSASAGTLSDDELFERMERARLERERKAKEEEERKAREKAEAERIVWEFTTRSKIVNGVLEKYKESYVGQPDKVIITADVTKIGAKAFSNCAKIKSITIPDSVTEIGDEAFYGCDGLTDITIPNSVTKLGNKVFSSCSGLVSVTIPNSMTKIWDRMFSGCSSLVNITIPNSVKEIEECAFGACRSLSEITIPKSVTKIGDLAFLSCRGLTNITIPSSVKSIGDNAFELCENLKQVTMPKRLAGARNENLKKIFPEIYKQIEFTFTEGKAERVAREKAEAENKAKQEAERIAKAELERKAREKEEAERIAREKAEAERKAKEEAERIKRERAEAESRRIRDIWENHPSVFGFGNYNMSEFKIDYSKLKKYTGERTNIIIPEGVTEICGDAFKDCYHLKSVIIPNSVTKIGNSAFLRCSNLADIIIPNGVKTIGQAAFKECKRLESITIPDSVTEIGEDAFFWCWEITSMVIPNGVKIINEGVFAGCEKLASVTIPNSVTKIDNRAFNSCKSLKSIIIPSSVTEIGGGALRGCSGLTNITIPNSVKKIGDHAFLYCIGLTSITIPDGVTEIGENAFNGCDNLLSVTMPKKFKWHLAKIFGKDLKKTVQFTFTK